MGIWSQLKMDPQNVHQRICQKGSKTRQNDEVQRQKIRVFRVFLAKTRDFKALRAKDWPEPSKQRFLVDFQQKPLKNGDLGQVFGPEEGLGPPEKVENW